MQNLHGRSNWEILDQRQEDSIRMVRVQRFSLYTQTPTNTNHRAALFKVQHYEKTLPPRKFPNGHTLHPALGQGCLRNVTSYHDVSETILEQTLPCLLVNIIRKPDDKKREFSRHSVSLVNLSRPYKDTDSKPSMSADITKRLGKMYYDKPETRNVTLEHYRGGPMEAEKISHCIVRQIHYEKSCVAINHTFRTRRYPVRIVEGGISLRVFETQFCMHMRCLLCRKERSVLVRR